jgi:hypothetical protein
MFDKRAKCIQVRYMFIDMVVCSPIIHLIYNRSGTTICSNAVIQDKKTNTIYWI